MARVPTPEERLTIDVPERGPVSAIYARPGGADASLVVFHGAGAGMEHPFMAGFARAMADEGIAILRCNFPYIEAGRRSPDSPGVAIATVLAAFEAARGRAAAGEPVWVGGKSYGGRMASMAVADGLEAAGLVFLGYPLHPPGKPERARTEHLSSITVPMLFLQGTKDPFATSAVLEPTIADLAATATLHPIEGGGHSFERSRKDDPREVGASLAPIAAAFIREASVPDAQEEPKGPGVLRSPRASSGARGRAVVGDGAGVRGPPRRGPEGVSLPGMRPHDPARAVAPRRRSRGRRGRAASLAHGLLEARAPPPRALPSAAARLSERWRLGATPSYDAGDGQR